MFTVISLLIIFSGVVSIVIGLVLLVNTIGFLSSAVRTKATVVAHETQLSQDGPTTTAHVHPVVEFKDGAGQQHRVTMATGTAGFQPFLPGSQVPLLFLPSNPSKARIQHFTHLWLMPCAFTFLGIFGVVFGLIFRSWTSFTT